MMDEAKQLSRQQVQMQIVASGKAQRSVSSQMQMHQSIQSTGQQHQSTNNAGSQPSQNPLTLEMIINKHKLKTNDVSQLKNVNLCLFEIDNLAVLRQLPNLEIVSLSHNKVSTFKDLAHCSKLQEIYIRKNNICDLQEVAHLSRLPNLRVLWLSHNPCAEHPYYRPYVVRKL